MKTMLEVKRPDGTVEQVDVSKKVPVRFDIRDARSGSESDARGWAGRSFEGLSSWFELIDELFEIEGVAVFDVKEKFGELNVHAMASREGERKIVEICEKSRTICEVCGAPGTIRNHRWLKTLCDRCNVERERRA